jgi:hypothetical protein
VDEKDIHKDPNHVMMVKKTTHFNKKGGDKKKGKSKAGGEYHMLRKSKVPKPDTKNDVECFFYKEKGHWKRNFPM